MASQVLVQCQVGLRHRKIPCTHLYREIGQMTRGDYLIHVFIEQGRQMKCPENRTVDPMIECSVLGEKKYSSIKKGIT